MEPTGVWIAYGQDLNLYSVTPFSDELAARRFAMEKYLMVEWVEFGTTLDD